jgi:hypothetical protein
MVVIDMSTFAKPEIKDSPVAYESRTIVADAQRAALMREPIAKSCFWRPGTRQYDLWVATYEAARVNHG